jgi:hypothetical protein
MRTYLNDLIDSPVQNTAANSTYPKGGGSCFADSFVGIENSVLRINFSGKNPALRVAAFQD